MGYIGNMIRKGVLLGTMAAAPLLGGGCAVEMGYQRGTGIGVLRGIAPCAVDMGYGFKAGAKGVVNTDGKFKVSPIIRWMGGENGDKNRWGLYAKGDFKGDLNDLDGIDDIEDQALEFGVTVKFK